MMTMASTMTPHSFDHERERAREAPVPHRVSLDLSSFERRKTESAPPESAMLRDMESKPLRFGPYGTKNMMHLGGSTKEVEAGPRSPPRGLKCLEPNDTTLSNGHSSSQPTASSSKTLLDPSFSTSSIQTQVPSTPTRKGKEIASSKSLCPDEIDLSWFPPLVANKRIAAGLFNPSMACYVNATLQVLLHTPAILRIATAHKKDECLLATRKFCMLCALKDLLQDHWTGKKRHYAPKAVHGSLGHIKKGFNKNRQEDTHEFFRFVTDALQATALAGQPKDLPDAIKHSTWVYKLWGGKVRSRVLCSRCNEPSDTFDRFLDLSLDVNKDRQKTVLDMLKSFIREDRLDGANKYHCEKCKAKTMATKGMKIAEAPPILTLHLKRFSVNYSGYGNPRADKISNHIEFGEYLDISPFMVDPSTEECKYRLFAVTCHHGPGLRYGHYTSYVKSPSGQWCKADDEELSPVGLNTVLHDKAAYLLSYVRLGNEDLVNGHSNGVKKPFGPHRALSSPHLNGNGKSASGKSDSESEQEDGEGNTTISHKTPHSEQKINILAPRPRSATHLSPIARLAHPSPTRMENNKFETGRPEPESSIPLFGSLYNPTPPTSHLVKRKPIDEQDDPEEENEMRKPGSQKSIHPKKAKLSTVNQKNFYGSGPENGKNKHSRYENDKHHGKNGHKKRSANQSPYQASGYSVWQKKGVLNRMKGKTG
ncbi:hypothetical protein P7C73_g6269, partial [Tremellales sp. Uapishka_1]